MPEGADRGRRPPPPLLAEHVLPKLGRGEPVTAGGTRVPLVPALPPVASGPAPRASRAEDAPKFHPVLASRVGAGVVAVGVVEPGAVAALVLAGRVGVGVVVVTVVLRVTSGAVAVAFVLAVMLAAASRWASSSWRAHRHLDAGAGCREGGALSGSWSCTWRRSPSCTRLAVASNELTYSIATPE